MGEGQERRTARRSSSAAGCRARGGGATASARCVVGVARGRRSCATPAASAPASPRPSSTALADAARRRSQRDDSPFDAGGQPPPRDAVFVEPRARRRGRVPRVDAGRRDARAVLQGPARRQGARGGRARARRIRRRLEIREATVKATRSSTAASSRSRTSTRSCIRRPASRKRDVIDVLRDDRAGRCCRTSSGRPLTLKRYPNGVDAPVLLREAGAVAPAGVGADRGRADGRRRRSTSSSATTARRSCGSPTSPTSSCTRRSRAPTTSARPTVARLRPRPRAAGDDRRVLPRRARCSRACSSGLGLQSVPQDLGLEGPAGVRPAELARRPTTTRRASRRRSPSCSSASEPKLVVSRMTKTLRAGQGARRLEPERRAQDDGQRLLAARAGAPDRVDAARRGTRSARARPAATRSGSCSTPTRSARGSTSTATSSRPVVSLVQRLPAV